MKMHVNPFIGHMPVSEIEQRHIVKVLTPLWITKETTARKVYQRVTLIMDWAKAHGHRTGDNPANGAEFGLPKQLRKGGHHGSVAVAAIPAFVAKLRAHNAAEAVTRLSLEWLILTATRQTETRGARWDEIDAKAKVWTVPQDRMKSHVPHRVPLSDRCLTILDEMRSATGNAALIFGNAAGAMLSENTHNNLVKAVAGDDEPTCHGMRSSFKDWAVDMTKYPSELSEAALAHLVKDKTQAAYERTDRLEPRRPLMQDWADYCASKT